MKFFNNKFKVINMRSTPTAPTATAETYYVAFKYYK